MKKIAFLLIIINSFVFWGKIVTQVPMGEGYYYFDRCQNKFIVPPDCPTTVWQFDNLARIMFQTTIPLFGDNIHMYMVLQVVILIILYTTLYLILFKITKNHLFSLLSTLLFLTNYVGSFSMIATGNYQRFAQRIPNLIPLLVSFYFLTKYLDKPRPRNLILFGILFISSVYLSHHSLFLLPVFISYILIYTFAKKINSQFLLKSALLIIFLIFTSLILTKTDHFVPKQGLVNFVLTTPQIIQKTLLQISNLIAPTEAIKYIAKKWPGYPVSYPFTIVLQIFSVVLFPVLIIPLFSKKKTKTTLLYKASLLALPLICFLNLYAYGSDAPHPLKNFGEDRIYFIPSLLSSIVIGYFFDWLIRNKSLIIKVLSLGFFIYFLVYNYNLINKDFGKLTDTSIKMEKFIDYIKLKTQNRDIKYAVVGPSHLIWPLPFVDHFYNTNSNLKLVLDSTDLNQIDIFGYEIINIDYQDNQIIETKTK